MTVTENIQSTYVEPTADPIRFGAPFLEAFWEDLDFDPSQRAFYYVRVLEIPTPSWLTYDSAVFGVEIPEGKADTQQERAYTSPIWYTPR
jgi:hypothetical protein